MRFDYSNDYSHYYDMKSVSKSELKARMLELFREVQMTGETLVVTDHRRPVLQVTPYRGTRSAEEVFGALRGQVEYAEDPTAPTEDEWPLP